MSAYKRQNDEQSMTQHSSHERAQPRHRASWLLGTLAAAIMATNAYAQDLPDGVSNGLLTLPDGTSGEISYEVSGAAEGAPNVTLVTGASRYPLTKFKISDSQISFRWVPGDDPIVCTLMRTSDNGYAGECPDPEGGDPLKITFVPPEAE